MPDYVRALENSRNGALPERRRFDVGQNDMAYTSATKGKLTMRLEKHLDQGLASIEDQMQRRLLGRAEESAFGERQQNTRRSFGRKLALFAATARILSNLQHS